MVQWAPEDVEAHVSFMKHVSELLEENGEYTTDGPLPPERDHLIRQAARPPAR